MSPIIRQCEMIPQAVNFWLLWRASNSCLLLFIYIVEISNYELMTYQNNLVPQNNLPPESLISYTDSGSKIP